MSKSSVQTKMTSSIVHLGKAAASTSSGIPFFGVQIQHSIEVERERTIRWLRFRDELHRRNNLRLGRFL